MKRNIFLIMLIGIVLITFNSCENNGSTYQKLNGDEYDLPEELKGLKVYNIKVGALDYIKVAVLDNKVVGTKYSEGKYSENVVIVQGNDVTNTRTIIVKEIISENDSILVVKKLK